MDTLCLFGRKCLRPNCRYHHPNGRAIDEEAQRGAPLHGASLEANAAKAFNNMPWLELHAAQVVEPSGRLALSAVETARSSHAIFAAAVLDKGSGRHGPLLTAAREFAEAQMERQSAALNSNTRKANSSAASAGVVDKHNRGLKHMLACADQPLTTKLLCDTHAIVCGARALMVSRCVRAHDRGRRRSRRPRRRSRG